MFQAQPLRLEWPDDLPMNWNDGSPFRTQFLNALSITFPDGERFFIDSIKAYKDRVSDPQQLAEIDEFVKQENWHRYVHIQYTDWMARKGLPAASIEHLMKDFWTSLRRKWSPMTCLAATVCIEHITATNADLFLSYRTILKRMHPHFEQVWRWHGIEEIEHKAIAIDLYNAVGGELWRRRLAMIVVLWYYSYFMLRNTLVLLHADKQLWRWRTVKDAWNLFFFKDTGLIRFSLPHIWRFMRADWHPNQLDHSIFFKYSKT